MQWREMFGSAAEQDELKSDTAAFMMPSCTLRKNHLQLISGGFLWTLLFVLMLLVADTAMCVNVLLQALFHKVWIRFQAPAEAFLLLCKVNSKVGERRPDNNWG